jgi:putative ABC transport system substrate-binding protein
MASWVNAVIPYGTSVSDLFRRAASYAGRILKGTRLSDLPVEQPSKFDLAVNLKTARTLGLIVPESLWATADELIQ